MEQNEMEWKERNEIEIPFHCLAILYCDKIIFSFHCLEVDKIEQIMNY
jgi:hypothetical protein